VSSVYDWTLAHAYCGRPDFAQPDRTPRHLHRTMPTTRLLSLAAFVHIAFAIACGSSNPTPQTESAPNDGRLGRPGGRDSSVRRNTVIENNRPDVGARAGLLVVANQQGASATVLDAATLNTVATVPVGQGPHEVAISTDGRWAVVTNYGVQGTAGNTLSVIDLAAETPAVVRTIDLGQYQRPHGAAFVKSGTKLLVTSETAQRLLLVDFISGRVDTAMATNGRGSHMVTVQRDGRRAWTSNITDGTVTEFDIDSRTTKRTFAVAPNVEGISATPGGVQVWVGSNSAKTVTVVNGADAKILGTISGFGQPYRVGASRSGRVVLVSDPPSNRIWIYDTGTRKELAQIDLASEKGVGSPAAQAGPEGITFDPITEYAYVTLHGTNQVVAIDLRTRKAMGFGSVGAGPDGIGYSPLVRR
jgi:YVTN family beta-propeller protein